jgi:uncharacterized protein (DUF2126 family)/transglutaminase-like putative cysteine protease
MGIHVALNHRTDYRYPQPIFLGPQVIQLCPAPHCRIPILSYSLDVIPGKHLLHWQMDPHSNRLARLLFSERTDELVVDVNLVADLSPTNPFDFLLEPGVEEYPFTYTPDLAKDLEPFRSVDVPGQLLEQFLAPFQIQSCGTVSFLLKVNHAVRDAIAYETRLAPGVQTSEVTLERRSGSCRDSAWLLVEILRNLGVAARFVSGYLIQLDPDGTKPDSADLHAWTEAYLPGAGWIGFDPTSGLLAGEGHIPLVCTPTAAQAAPIAGTAEQPSIEFSYSITVRRVNSDRTPSLPFSEEEWQRVRSVARAVDVDLKAHDVRLTMGGEPTFVAVDEPESAQWNVEALGAAKKTRGLALIRDVSQRIASGALLHYGQGKWYPGEPLPRWALSCYWRTDGVPVWEDVGLIAREDQNDSRGVSDALRFIEALARRLQLSTQDILPAHNPSAESEGPAGYILPIRRRQPAGRLRWSSQLWFPRPERLILSPGDSPIGYRIPVEVVPWVAPDDLEYEMDAPPFADCVKLPTHPARRENLFATDPDPDSLPAVAGSSETAREQIRPSLCVEAREGRLHVFLPYAPVVADYLDLVSGVEDTCRFLNMPVWVEGYAPAPDPRLRSFSVTPDPGVLEINLPPASTWDELEEINTILDVEARKNLLVAKKFDYDGTQKATGGGSHIVIGGATVLDSPILRRPDLLRSMLAFWQNHPSLSFLFSGQYVGPTSQYPRVDEARIDTLYELELVFQHLPCGDCPPWVVDGLFRNLLADVSGNTHRAEFCVDKLFPPPGQGLQLGLLELRAFEMPPHVRMGLLQMLLVRALVCSFWKTPFEGTLVRWGAALHDRFMLPHYVKKDLAEVLVHLRQSGFNFQDEWFAAQTEFRFPRIGTIVVDGVELELRRALEPWNVLAEETVSGRTVRNVDSSLERIQVKLSGSPTEARYVVACNGRRVPLQSTVEPGTSVAGVRFRARKLSAALHPTIPVHAPLVFEIIDLWMNRSVGQCSYFAGPPDGRGYASRPADAAEAERRRLERFQISAPALNGNAPPPEEPNPVFPGTLDLRVPSHGLQGPGQTGNA